MVEASRERVREGRRLLGLGEGEEGKELGFSRVCVYIYMDLWVASRLSGRLELAHKSCWPSVPGRWPRLSLTHRARSARALFVWPC